MLLPGPFNLTSPAGYTEPTQQRMNTSINITVNMKTAPALLFETFSHHWTTFCSDIFFTLEVFFFFFAGAEKKRNTKRNTEKKKKVVST